MVYSFIDSGSRHLGHFKRCLFIGYIIINIHDVYHRYMCFRFVKDQVIEFLCCYISTPKFM